MAGAKEPSAQVDGAPEAAENATYQRSERAASLTSDPAPAAPLLACGCFPHGPNDACTCSGCWTCFGRVEGCTCDIGWDCEHGENR